MVRKLFFINITQMVEEKKKFLLKDFLLKMKADDHVHNVKRKLSIVK